jgi:hypothetical protein
VVQLGDDRGELVFQMSDSAVEAVHRVRGCVGPGALPLSRRAEKCNVVTQPFLLGGWGVIAGEVHVPFDRFFHMTAISLSPLDTEAFPITSLSASIRRL